MKKPFLAYRGGGPYVFVCYSHEDSDAVFREVAWLNDYGVNVWHDEGISPGHEWREELAAAIQGCTKVLYFISPRSVVSEHCRRELNFAQEENREVVAVHLEPTEMPAGLRLGLNNRQAILKFELSEEEFHKRLMRAIQGGSSVAVPSSSSSGRAWPRYRVGLVIAAVALIAFAVGGRWLYTWNIATEGAESVAGAAVDQVPAGDVLHNSIAVLPFANLSPDPDDAYFAAGIHEEILNQLAKIKDLSVIARTTMTRYADTALSVPEIGSELNVQTVMEGSVRYAGNRVRITAQLIDAQSGAQLWSEAYEQNLDDIFAIQYAIAARIATTLEAEFSDPERERVAARLTSDPEAYAHYLRALSDWGNFAAVESMIEALDRAIEIDPTFAAAMAFKAWIYFTTTHPRFLSQGANAAGQRQALTLAKEYASRAIELDNTQARAHYVLGGIQFVNRRWQARLKTMELAYSLNPSDYAVLGIGGTSKALQGDIDGGFELLRRAVEINPANVANTWFVGDTAYRFQRWFDARREATAVMSSAPDLAVGYALLAKVNAQIGDEQAVRHYASLAEARNPGPYDLTDIALSYGKIGDIQEAKRIFDAAMSSPQARPGNPDWLFWMNMAIGDYAEALIHLERMVLDNFPAQTLVLFHDFVEHPDYDPIRADPLFDKLVEQVNTPLESPDSI